MKKVISVFVASLFLFSLMSISVYANDSVLDDNAVEVVDLSNIDFNNEAQLKQMGITIISSRPANNSEINTLRSNQPKARAITRGTTYSIVQNWTQVCPQNKNFSAEMQAIIELTKGGNYIQINRVSSLASSLASGLYTASWSQINSSVRSTSGKWPSGMVEMIVTGKFYSTTSVSAGVSGFGVSVTSGKNVTYVSPSMTIQRTYKSY